MVEGRGTENTVSVIWRDGSLLRDIALKMHLKWT